METRKKSFAEEERSDLANRPGLSSENLDVNDEENLDTRNVAHDIEEGDEDYDDEELEESDFDIDDDDEDDEDDEDAHPNLPGGKAI